MVYNVIITDTAKRTFQNILDDVGRYTPQARLEYLNDLEAQCNLLHDMPERFPELIINIRTYRHFTYKAHRIFYQINYERFEVYIVAILHGRQLPKKHLG